MKYLFLVALMIFGLSLSAQPVYKWTSTLANWIDTNPQGLTDTTLTAVILWETAPDSLFRSVEIRYDSEGLKSGDNWSGTYTKDVVLRHANRQILQANDETQFLFKEYQAVLDKKNYWQAVKNQIE